MEPEVAALLAALKHPRDAEIRGVRAIILGADPRIREGVKWNAPSYFTTEHFATFHLRGKSAIQVVLHLGARGRPDARLRERVPDPSGLLEWRGADRAIVTFTSAADVEAKRAAFGDIVRAWAEHV
jgi:hypothetical protein